MHFAPVDISDEKDTWHLGKTNLTLDFTPQGIRQADMTADKLVYQEAETKTQVQFNNIKAMAEYQPIKEWDLLSTGQQWIAAGETNIEETDEQGKTNLITVKNWKIDLNTVRKEAFLDFAMNLMNMAFNHLDGETLNQVLHAKFAQTEDAPLTDAEIALLRKFFDKQPQFAFHPMLTTQAGKLAADIDVAVATSDLATLSRGKIFNLFQHFIFKVNADKAALVEVASAAEQISAKVEKAQADRTAEIKVNDGLKNPIQQGILVDDGKQVKLDLVLENGELKLNGKVIPEEQVASILFLATMSMGY